MASAKAHTGIGEPSYQTLGRTSRVVANCFHALFWALMVASGSSCSPDSTGPRPLAPSRQQAIHGGESYTAAVACRPGDTILTRVAQDNIDVTLELVDGIGSDSKRVDFPSGRFGDEFLVFNCGSAGHHQILVRNAATSNRGGTVTIGSFSLTTAAQAVIEAYQHMTNAATLNAVRGDDVWPSVLGELATAGALWKRLGMQHELALSEFATAYVEYMDLTEWPAAVEHAAKAAEVFSALGDTTGEAASLQLQGAALEEAAAAVAGASDSHRQQMFDASAALLRDAEREYQTLARPFDVAMSEDYLAINDYLRGREDAATAEFEATAQAFRSLQETSAERMVLQNVATIHYENGSYAKAKTAFETLLPLMTPDDDPYLYATILHNSALVQSVTGEFETALDRELRALAIQKRLDSKAGQARSLYAIGIVYERLGEYARALEYLKNSLALGKQGLSVSTLNHTQSNSQRRQVLGTLIEIGNIERTRGHFPAAVSVHSDARNFSASEKSDARVDLALGLDYAAMDKVDLALSHFTRAQARGTPDSNPYFVEIAIARSKALRKRVEAASGLVALQTAERIARANDNLREQALVALELASSHAALGARRAALDAITRGIELAERLSRNTQSPQLKIMTMASERDAYRQWVNLLLQGNPPASRRVMPARAALDSLLVADRSLDQGLLEQLQRRSLTSTASGQESFNPLYEELAGKRATLDSLLERDSVDAAKVQQLRNEIALLQAKVDLLGKAPAGASPATTPPGFSAATLKTVQQELPRRCVLIEYMLSEPTGWAWVVRRGGVSLYSLPSDGKIKSLVSDARRALVNPLGDAAWEGAVGTLANAILTPVLSDERPECLVFVPDGVLHYLPFAVLARALYGDEQRLPAISVVPSLRVLREANLRGEPAGLLHRVVVFPQHATSSIEAAPSPALRSVDAEVGAIQTAFGRDNTYVANAKEASRAGFTHFDFRGYDIVHIAAHGHVDASVGGLSRLSFADGNDMTADLRSLDIASMRLDTALIVLSACETGLGQPVDGEGLVGLVDAFIGAGAGRVLTSLWKVPDEATSQLMGVFYRELHQPNVSPEQALMVAQRETRSATRWRSPYYWSGFQIVSTRLTSDTNAPVGDSSPRMQPSNQHHASQSGPTD